jgi:uncharacterized membrane protein
MKHDIFSRSFWSERDVEQYIGKLLRYGVVIACTITTLGGIIYMLQRNGEMPNYKALPSGVPFEGVDAYLRGLKTILPQILNFDGAAIIQFGVIVLIATPIARVAFSVISFLIEKDYMYVTITLIVLCIILANMIFGFH